MTVIDVNTGKFTGQGGNLEETVTRNNLEAAEEIVRQLRLRDVGGIVVIDFIDMVLESNRELVLRRLLECLARDRTKHQVAEVTSLGLVQMTRKRVGAGLLEAFSTPCECCNGRGVILTFDPDTDSQASHHTHGRGGAGHSGAGHGGNGGRVPAPAAIASPASVAARARPADIPPPAATSEADATAPDGPAANGRQPEAQADATQGDGQADNGQPSAAQDNGQPPAAPAEPARSGSGRRRRRKPSGTSAASGAPAAPAASAPEAGGPTAMPQAQDGAA
jgi:ribonuclease E